MKTTRTLRTAAITTTTMVALLVFPVVISAAGKDNIFGRGRPTIDFEDTTTTTTTDLAATGNGKNPIVASTKVPVDVLAKWKQSAGLKADVDLSSRFQAISKQNTVIFPTFGLVDLNDLEPYNVFSPNGVVCYVDGELIDEGCGTTTSSSSGDEGTGSTTTTFMATKKATGAGGGGSEIKLLVAYSSAGNLLYIKAMGQTPGITIGKGRAVNVLEAIEDTNVLTYLTEDDFDPEWISQFSLEYDEIIDAVDTDGGRRDLLNNDNNSNNNKSNARKTTGQTLSLSGNYNKPLLTSSSTTANDESLRRSLRGQVDQKIQQEEQEQEPQQQQHVEHTHHSRDLQQYRVVELAVATDSTYCAAYGGSAQSTVNKIIAVVADVATEYEQPGLEFTVKLTGLEINCNPNNDPYSATIGLSGCRSSGLLQAFRSRWNTNFQSIQRDTAQLLVGTSMDALGCAYVRETCIKSPSTSAAYGVNWLTYTTSTVGQKYILTHEMGHNVGANHDDSTTANIMFPSYGTNDKRFSAQSIGNFTDSRNIGTDGCIEFEEPSSKPSDPPVVTETEPAPTPPAPVPTPTTAPPPPVPVPPQTCTTKAEDGESCREPIDCCSGRCSSGKPSRRVCLSPPGPTPPTSPPVAPPPSCVAKNRDCSTDGDCCSNNCKNNGRCG